MFNTCNSPWTLQFCLSNFLIIQIYNFGNWHECFIFISLDYIFINYNMRKILVTCIKKILHTYRFYVILLILVILFYGILLQQNYLYLVFCVVVMTRFSKAKKNDLVQQIELVRNMFQGILFFYMINNKSFWKWNRNW